MANKEIQSELARTQDGLGASGESTKLEERFGKYRLIKLLGSGASGMVYLAEDTLLAKEVALKILDDKGNARAHDRDRFILEARSAAKLSDPRTVSVYEINEAQGRFYIAMEWVQGGSVQQAIDARGPIPWREATKWVLDAAHALTAAHEAGMLHRDIKPGNLLLTGDGRAKLGDFGLVKLTGEASPMLTALGGPIGTPSYMSPEQCQGESIDERSDIYSLGATYFALLTGRPPYQSETSFGVMFAHCSSPIPDPSSVDANLPGACAAIIYTCMAKRPADRYSSARALAADLEKLLGIEQSPTIPAPVPPSQPRRRALPLAGALLAVVIATLAAFWPRTPTEAPPPTQNPPQPAQPVATTAQPAVTTPAPNLSRKDPLFSRIHFLGTHRGAVNDVAFDAKGKFLLSVGQSGAIARWDITDPSSFPINPTRLVDAENSEKILFGLAYFPTRDRIITGGDRPEIVLWDLKNQKVLARAAHPHGVVRALDASPDGVMFATGGDLGWNLWELTPDDKMIDKGPITKDLALVYSVKFCHNTRHVGAAAGSGSFAVFDLFLNRPFNFKRLDRHETCIAFGKTRAEFASGARNGIITLGKTTQRAMRSGDLSHWGRAPLTLDFAPDRRLLAAGGEAADTITFFDIDAGTRFKMSTGRGQPIQSLEFSPDGKQMAIANLKGELLLVDLPLERFPPPTPKEELAKDMTANLLPNPRQLEAASKTIENIFGPKKVAPEP